MLPGKAEKRIASSIFITLVPPRREVATKEKIQREPQPDGAELWGTHHSQTPPPQRPTCPNGGEGVRGAGRMVMVPRMLWRCFAKGCACRQEGMWGFGGSYSPSPHTHPGMDPAAGEGLSPVPSSPPVLILSKAPQPLSAETLGPALQQLDLAAPATLQAPSAFPAEWRAPKFCQERAGKPQWQDANGYPERDVSRDICAFCHKAVGPREPTVEAMRKQYHANCFTCRTCHRLLAGQSYYQKDGRPTCDACYQATLEKCAKCGGLIAERIVRALGKVYHPNCFSCAACGRAIGTESFAVDEQDEVYCVADFYR
ncbi:FBLI1 protein, partial [Geococcyx californianus]|nr:FBLI1 protein [Geococcyx californianus]